MLQADRSRLVLFLQGPLSPLYSRLAERLKRDDLGVRRINFCIGDVLHWDAGDAISYKGRPENWRPFLADYLDRHTVSDLVLHGDRRFYHRVAIEEAKKRGIYIAVSELGLLRPDWMTFERDGLSVRSHFPDQAEQIRAIAANSPSIDFSPRFQTSFWKVAVPDMVYNLLNTGLWFLFPHYERHTIYFPPFEYLAHGMRVLTKGYRDQEAIAEVDFLKYNDVPVFLVPMQLEGDFQLRENSPFNGMAGALDAICASFKVHAPGDAVLLLKSHPLDNGLDGWKRVVRSLARAYGLEGRLLFADGGDLLAMAAIAKGVVTVNSTAGLDVMQKGVPVKTLAPAIFDVAGLSDQQPLDTFWNNPQAPECDLVAAFVKAIAATIQVRGTIYNEAGLDVLVETMAERLLARSLNEPYGYCATPPRLHRLERLKDNCRIDC